MSKNEREKNPLVALPGLIKTLRPHIGQFLFVGLMVVFCGGIKSTCKFSQALMTWEDKNNNGIQDWSTEKGEFQVDTVVRGTQFLVAFGVAKAVSNYIVGVSSDAYGKKPVMIVGWILGLLVPIMVLTADSWDVVVASNVFLGIQQGLVWSLTIFMFIDYCGPSNRGVAVGMNETIGYTSVALFNLIAAQLVSEGSKENADYRTGPYIMILIFCIIGLFGTIVYVKDTKWLITKEEEAGKETKTKQDDDAQHDQVTIVWPSGRTKVVSVFRMSFVEASFLNKNLMACCQAGLMINFLTAFVWGILTKWIKSYGNAPSWNAFDKKDTADIILAYGLTKGLMQFMTGYIADRVGRKPLIVAGLWIAGLGVLLCWCVGQYIEGQAQAKGFLTFSTFLIGLGTSFMYPNVIAAAAEHADPSWRASAVGTYRFWRDSGYWIGGLVLGSVADASNIGNAVLTGSILAFFSGLIFLVFYEEHVEKQIDFAEILTDKRNRSSSQDVPAEQALTVAARSSSTASATNVHTTTSPPTTEMHAA